jgi:hypothetical protein
MVLELGIDMRSYITFFLRNSNYVRVHDIFFKRIGCHEICLLNPAPHREIPIDFTTAFSFTLTTLITLSL